MKTTVKCKSSPNESNLLRTGYYRRYRFAQSGCCRGLPLRKNQTTMKTTFTLQQVKELLRLTSAQQQQIINYGDSLAKASDEEIAASAVDDDAPAMIRDLHRRSVRRARAAISRRRRSLQYQPAVEDERQRQKAERYLQWFRDTIIPQIVPTVRENMYVVSKVFSKLSPRQIAEVSRHAYMMLTEYIRRAMKPLLQPA